MKNLYSFLIEEIGLSTPLNTTGIGNPMPPTGDSIGSEPLSPIKNRKKKKKILIKK